MPQLTADPISAVQSHYMRESASRHGICANVLDVLEIDVPRLLRLCLPPPHPTRARADSRDTGRGP